MKTQRISFPRRGFTLIELMVAMAITTIIVTVLVSITSIAMDTWNRSREELRAARQGKAMVDTMARDFEAMVTRRGNEYEWLAAESPASSNLGPRELQSTNAADLIFFSGSTERYKGEIGGTNDNGGDVSCIGYRLIYDDPVKKNGDFKTFVLKRVLKNPDVTFDKLLGQKNLKTAFSTYSNELDDLTNFVCENVFQFTVTFQVEVTQGSGSAARVITVPVSIGQSSAGQMTDSLKIKGTGIETSASPSGVTADELKAGRIKAMEVSLTVLSDAGINQINSGRAFSPSQKAEFMAKNSYQYSKRVEVPGL